MRKFFCLCLLVFLTACDSNKPDYILNETAFCTGLGTLISDLNPDPVVCTDADNNLLSGRIVGYFSNGKIYRNFVVKNGNVEGISKKYYENGHLERELFYVNGNVEGVAKDYYANGNLQKEGYIKNLRYEGNIKVYFENGKLQWDIMYEAGKLNGIVKQFYANGGVATRENYKDGKLEGNSKHYYENGQLRADENYQNGQKEGRARYYYNNGNLYAEVFYKQGKSNGNSRSYYKNGQLMLENIRQEGDTEFIARAYTNFGEILLDGKYDKGMQTLQLDDKHVADLSKKCKEYFNVCNEMRPVIGCMKKLTGRVNAVYPDGVIVNSSLFIYTTKKYASNDKINSDYYYTYEDMRDYTASDGSMQRVRAYRETDIEALCDDLYKPFEQQL